MDEVEKKIIWPALRQRLEHIMWAGLALTTAAVLWYVAFNHAIMPWYTGQGDVLVPDVVELDIAEAKALLSDSGLVFVSDPTDWEYHPDIPANFAVSQRPQAYTTVKPGRRVRVRISLGQKRFGVPDVVGKPLIQAYLLLQQVGYEVGNVTYVLRNTEDRSERYVLSQHPPAGTMIPLNETMGLEVSIIPDMPNLVGRSESKSLEVLQDMGLRVGSVKRKRSTDFLPGSVVEQSISPGDRIRPSSTVHLTISRY